MFSIASIIVHFFLFEVGMDTAFVCSRTAFSLQQWPLSASKIYCTCVELANLQLLLWLNMGALLVIVLAIICGIFMLTIASIISRLPHFYSESALKGSTTHHSEIGYHGESYAVCKAMTLFLIKSERRGT